MMMVMRELELLPAKLQLPREEVSLVSCTSPSDWTCSRRRQYGRRATGCAFQSAKRQINKLQTVLISSPLGLGKAFRPFDRRLSRVASRCRAQLGSSARMHDFSFGAQTSEMRLRQKACPLPLLLGACTRTPNESLINTGGLISRAPFRQRLINGAKRKGKQELASSELGPMRRRV